MADPLAALSTSERAIAWCVAVTGDDRALGCLPDETARRCRAALEGLAALGRAERARALATAVRVEPLPEGLDRVPAARIAAALAPEPPPLVAWLLGEAPDGLRRAVLGELPGPVRDAVGRATPARPDRAVRAWLRRCLLGGLA